MASARDDQTAQLLELIELASWPTRARARTATVHWLEAIYNRRRRHSAIDMLSPVDYEELRPSPSQTGQGFVVTERRGLVKGRGPDRPFECPIGA